MDPLEDHQQMSYPGLKIAIAQQAPLKQGVKTHSGESETN